MTALAQSGRAIVVNSFSKYFSHDGLARRLAGGAGGAGAADRAAGPEPLHLGADRISQVAALGAFDGIDELEAIKRGYADNRALLLDELPEAGLDARSCPPTAPSISMSTWALSRPTAAPSPSACCTRSASR